MRGGEGWEPLLDKLADEQEIITMKTEKSMKLI